ncbi:MAG: hypothetical protein AB8B49_01260 [Nitratireductor sp.]
MMLNDKLSKLLLAGLLTTTLAISGCASSSTNTAETTKVTNNAGAVSAVAEEDGSQEVFDVINRSRAHVKRSGEVYSMRGLLNIFSRGMDVMAKKLRTRGYDAISYNHGNWRPVAEDIVKRARQKKVNYPIVILGHSLGGNEASSMANYLGSKGIKVSFVATFDPTESRSVGKNIGKVVNYYLPNGRNTISKRSSFKGKLNNIDVTNITDIKHTNVEKNPGLQNKTFKTIKSITKPLSKRAKKKLFGTSSKT